MKTFKCMEAVPHHYDNGTMVHVVHPGTLKLVDIDCFPFKIYKFDSEAYDIASYRDGLAPIWDGRRNTYSISPEHYGHIVGAVMAQRDAAVEMLHDIRDELLNCGALAPQVLFRLNKVLAGSDAKA